jgi:outer membrane protein TolC
MIALVGCCLALGGCAHWYAAEADREVYELIRRTRQSLDAPHEQFAIDRAEQQETILPDLAASQGIVYDPTSTSDSEQPDTRPAGQTPDEPTTRPAGSAAASQPGAPATQPAMPTAIVLTLPDALRQAFLYSREYQDRKEGLYLQALALTLEHHLWTPQFVATFSAEMQRSGERPEVSRIFQTAGELGFTQRLPYGGEVTARVLYTLIEDLREGVNELPLDTEDSKSGSVEVSMSVPLLRGAGPTARESLIQARRDLIYEVRAYERFRREFCVRIASRYFSLLQQRKQVANVRVNWQNLRDLARRSEALFKKGRVTQLDVQRAQQEAFSAENDYIDATETYELSLDEFKILLSLPTTANVTLSDRVPRVPRPALQMRRAYELATGRRLDLMNVRDRVDDGRRQVAVARNGLLADLNLTASATVGAGDFRTFTRYQWDEADYRVGIELGLPVNRLSARNAYRRSLIELESRRRGHEQFSDRIKLEVRDAVRRVRRAEQAIEIQNQSIKLAKKRLDFANYRLKEGKIGNRDVVEAEQALLSARNRYEAAINGHRTAILEYMRDVGILRVGPDGMWQWN